MLSSILIFALVLSVLILVHELGHFFAAKKAGLWVEEFGFGIPPRIFGKKIGETLYSVNFLPFGGFVKIHGQNEGEDIKKPNRAFYKKGKLTRSIIITAGILMNFLLGIVCFAFVYTFSGIPREIEEVRIVGIDAESPAQKTGLMSGDVVRQIAGKEVYSTGDFISEIEKFKGEVLFLTIEREVDGQIVKKDFEIIPRDEYPEGQGPLGVVVTQSEIYFPPVWQRPFLGAYYGVKEAIFWGRMIIVGIFGMIVQLFSGTIPKDVAGPVGIFAITSEAAKIGTLSLVNFVGILSVNLAILNLLPFPALDGGILLFIIFEAIFGKKILPKAEAIIHNVGMIVLILLLLLITFYDVRRFVIAGSIQNFLETFVK